MAEATFSLDLHVLGPPLTFALSQDQTLHRKFEPALRRAWCGSVRGTAPTRNVEWFRFCDTKPTIYQTACYPVFRDRSLRRIPHHRGGFVSGLDEDRRGSVLIRGAGLAVNDDRRFFREPPT